MSHFKNSMVFCATTILGATFCSQAFAEDFFVKASANFKDGSKLEFNCVRPDKGTNNSMKEMFQPSMGNKENSYSIDCTNADRSFFSVFFKYTNAQNPTTIAFKPFTDLGKIPLEKQFDVFTVRAKGQDKEMYIHSFPHLPQHYESGAVMNVSSFAEEKDGANTFHVIAGGGSAKFNDKQMDGKSKNAPGELTWSFRIRAKYIKAPR